MILDLNFNTLYAVRVSNAAVYFQIVLTTYDPVKKPVTHILVKEMTISYSINLCTTLCGQVKGKSRDTHLMYP